MGTSPIRPNWKWRRKGPKKRCRGAVESRHTGDYQYSADFDCPAPGSAAPVASCSHWITCMYMNSNDVMVVAALAHETRWVRSNFSQWQHPSDGPLSPEENLSCSGFRL